MIWLQKTSCPALWKITAKFMILRMMHPGLRPARRKYGSVSSVRSSDSCRTGRSIYDDETITDQPAAPDRGGDDPGESACAVWTRRFRTASRWRSTGCGSGRTEAMMDIDATIICERDSHKGIIIGKGGAMLRRIGSQARRGDRKHAGDEGQSPALGQGEEGLARQRFHD